MVLSLKTMTSQQFVGVCPDLHAGLQRDIGTLPSFARLRGPIDPHEPRLTIWTEKAMKVSYALRGIANAPQNEEDA